MGIEPRKCTCNKPNGWHNDDCPQWIDMLAEVKAVSEYNAKIARPCRTGRTLLTLDWCFVHMRYIVNCIDAGIITEQEVWDNLKIKQ